jgi:O-antigen ligase
MYKDFKKNFDIVYLLILLIPILAVFSILLLEIALIVISFLFIFICVNEKKNFEYFNNFIFKFFLIFYLYLLTNYIIQSEQINTLSIIFYFRYSLYIIAIYFYFENKKNLFLNFLKVIFFLVLFLGIDTIFQSIFKYNLIGFKIITSYRASSFFGDELILGSFILRLLPFIFIICLFEKKIFNDKINSFFITFCFLIIFLSGERTSMILSGLLFVLYFFIFKKEKIFKYLKIYFSVFLIIISLILLFSKNYQFRYITQPLSDLSENYKVTQDLLHNYEKKPRIIYFSGLHHNLMITSLRIFKNNKIFGSGPRSYRDVCGDYKINVFSCDNHPHNFYIQLAAETGIIGLSFLILLYLIILNRFYNLSKAEKTQVVNIKLCILGFYIIALFPIMPSGNFFNNWLSILIYLPAATYLYLDKKTKVFS